MLPARAQVVVLGAGPAGIATARALAMLGHEVLVLHDEHGPRTPEVESLPPSAHPVVAQLGLTESVANARVAAMPGNTVCWAGEAATDTLLPEPGAQVDRSVLDRVLRFAAESAGVVLRSGIRALEVRELADGAAVRVRRGRDIATVTAAVVVVATGRSALRTGARRTRLRGWRTVALCGAWTDVPALSPPRDATTWIESGPRSWTWAVPLAGGRRQVTVMTAPPDRDAAPAELPARYRALLAETPQTAATVRGGRLEWLRATDASASMVSPVASGRVIRVGDACSTVDPIASFGIKKALTSARLAAAVVNTLLRGGRRVADQAVTAYQAAQAQELAGSMSGAAQEAARARAAHDGPFWERRTFRPARARSAPGGETSQAAVTRPAATSGALRLTAAARIEPRAVLEGWLFEERPTLVTAHWPMGLRYLGGVDVPALVQAAAVSGGATAELSVRYASLSGRAAAPEDLERVLIQLVERGVLA